MYKNILVPIAFDHGTKAKEATKIAQVLTAHGGKISLLYVIEPIPDFIEGLLPKEASENIILEAEKMLAKIVRDFAKGADCHVLKGHPGRSILRHAEETGVDCIVIASHKPGLEDYLLGSTAAHVARHAKCAVHIVR